MNAPRRAGSTAATAPTAVPIAVLLIAVLLIAALFVSGCAGDPAATPAIQDTSSAGAPSGTAADRTTGPPETTADGTAGDGTTGDRAPADGTTDGGTTENRAGENRTGESDGPVTLPWPAPTPGEAAALQTAVDGGSRPWLLEPSEVALSYVAAAHDWTEATTREDPTVPGTVVVRTPDGEQRTLTLAQPARTGPTGIWLVATDTPT